MKPKGTWSRILGLLMLLAAVTSCGNAVDESTATNDAPPAVAEAEVSAAPAVVAEASAAPVESAPAAAGGMLAVGSKNFTESVLMAEMYAQLLEANGFEVERKLRLGATDIAHQALLSGEIDLYPEYTSTGLLEVLKLPKENDRQQTLETLQREYEEQFDLTWLQPADFNNTNTFAMTRERAEELGIETYSDLFEQAGELTLGGPPEFLGREDTQGLQEAYGGFEFQDVKQLDPGLRYQALQDGQVDAVVAFSTDGQIGGFDLAALEDDKGFYPIYQSAPVIRLETLNAHPEIATILDPLAPKLDEQTMANLNWMVDGPEKMEPEAVAESFLQEQGLIN